MVSEEFNKSNGKFFRSMNRLEKIADLRKTLSSGRPSIGSWIQLPNSSIAEIMGNAGYDWVAVDLEHGSIDIHQLPDIFRALELGGTIPLVRLAHGEPKDCKRALDAGAFGVIAPMVESAEHLVSIRNACCWPPSGSRGVGFSRANLFGSRFSEYLIEAQAPLLVAMIENVRALENLDAILEVQGLDALLVGPYDLSSSLGVTGVLDHPKIVEALEVILKKSVAAEIPVGIHIVNPSLPDLKMRLSQGYKFIPFSIDSVFLSTAAQRPNV